MQWILDHMRFCSFAIIVTLLLELTPCHTAVAGEDGQVLNVRMERTTNQLIVHYDLISSSDKKWLVTLTLRREGIVLFRYSPKTLSGDCGKDVSPGTDKRIVWDYQREFPNGLSGDDYFVVVEANAQGSGLSPLVWVGGGVALMGGAALLLFSKKNDAGQSSAATAGFPAEPGRPK